MFMDGIFPDTVASIHLQNEIRTSLVVMALVAGVHPCVGKTAPPHLTSYPEAATDGADFTLSCTPAQGRILISVSWQRNNVNIFATSSDVDASADICTPNTTSPEYKSVSGRISVSSSLQQHNVALRTNSQLDQGSVWRCQSGHQFSNNITVEFKESIQDRSRPEATGPESTKDTTTFTTDGQHTGPHPTDDKDMMTTKQTVSTKTKAGKDNCKEGGHNEESKRETIVMEDNDLYHGFVRTENPESAEEQQVRDIYAKVNKVRKTHNATEVQITLSIEDLYAKPNKPASGKSEASKVSSNQNADVSTPDRSRLRPDQE